MGLIENMLISVVHLAFIVADVLLMVVVLKIVHDRWRIPWIEPILTTVRPAMSVVLNWFAALVLRATGKSYPEKTLLVLLIICLLVVRMIIVDAAK
jgi:chromate transport protein ChrA